MSGEGADPLASMFRSVGPPTPAPRSLDACIGSITPHPIRLVRVPDRGQPKTGPSPFRHRRVVRSVVLTRDMSDGSFRTHVSGQHILRFPRAGPMSATPVG